ncbi:hypothetical protein PFISCL1PPCAC_10754 [Pristionchus fissidentatus]|uniref:Uncharacterized protein n=1 Tax=Pristionchus fissidentatus TaxID=1538716 RepID=A0AAV5VL78_9BILA|nr:hypothetical protein PFISCL1PPCAC_10754 [Pristionchus fissidentatus]
MEEMINLDSGHRRLSPPRTRLPADASTGTSQCETGNEDCGDSSADHMAGSRPLQAVFHRKKKYAYFDSLPKCKRALMETCHRC